jgi:hypothetical protein
MRAMTETNGQVVALPFAKVEVHEPREHLLALAALVQDMAGVLARTALRPETDALLSRAEELVAKLR